MKFVLGIILSIILLMSSLGYDVNYAEARGDGEPCSYRMPHSFLKISNDPWKCEKVDYWVPEKCGIKAGLYKTDTSCQPPPVPEAKPEAKAEAKPEPEAKPEAVTPSAPTQTPFWLAFSTSSGFETGSLLVIGAIIIGPIAAFVVIRRRKKRNQEMNDEDQYDREQREAEDDQYERERERKQWEQERMEERQREQERMEERQREQAQREREKAKKRRQKGTHYDVLGVPKGASQKAIKDAYRKLSLKWHPDKNKSHEAAKRFNKIAEAYDVLSNKDKRKKYDAELDQ